MLSTVLPRLAASLHHWRRIARRLAWPQMPGPTLWAEHVVQQQLFHLSEDVRSRVFCIGFEAVRNVSMPLRHFGDKFRLQQEARRPPPAAAAGGLSTRHQVMTARWEFF